MESSCVSVHTEEAGMGKEITFEIPYIRLRFLTELLADARMPETKTAALRGGMGEMMLRQNCVMDRNCGKCFFHKACIVRNAFYTRMEKKPAYVTGDESVGYLIECTDPCTEFQKGSIFEFTMTLFGDSIAFFNIYLQAICHLGMNGLGKDRARFRILEVRNSGISSDQRGTVVRGNTVNIEEYRIGMLSDHIRKRKEKLQASNGAWSIKFLTPLSMKYRQEYMTEFWAEALVKGAARRVQMLDYYIGTESEIPEFSAYPEIRAQDVRRSSVKRYSGTQDSHMTLRGIKGKAVFGSMPDECLDYLIAGELIHIGRNTSFGFGKYVLGREGGRDSEL